jgi:guanylate kinase
MYSPFIIISSPSGGGKSTIIKYILQSSRRFTRAISVTTRPIRPGEKDGKDYYFVSLEEFKKKIDQKQLLEWEEVYPDIYYGTPISEIESASRQQKIIILSIDVNGAIELKKRFKESVLTIFLDIPDIDTLKARLRNRNTESSDELIKRLARVEYELQLKNQFDRVVMNDDLHMTVNQVKESIEEFCKRMS